ncbi:hypothetical protein DV737_g2294, partial [Chaetothyriales sp. CBS 132003]
MASPTKQQRIQGLIDPAILLSLAVKSPRDPNQPLEGSAAIISQLLPSAEGVVLELGPGSGDQIQNLKPARKQITKVYGAEPCIPLHKALRANARASGFGEDNVENVEETCDTLYRLLKPGGKLLFCEHVVNPWRTTKGSLLARALQTVYSLLGWTFFVGNCHLTRSTAQVLVNAPRHINNNKDEDEDVGASGWAEAQLDTHFGWSCLPYASGTLVK